MYKYKCVSLCISILQGHQCCLCVHYYWSLCCNPFCCSVYTDWSFQSTSCFVKGSSVQYVNDRMFIACTRCVVCVICTYNVHVLYTVHCSMCTVHVKAKVTLDIFNHLYDCIYSVLFHCCLLCNVIYMSCCTTICCIVLLVLVFWFLSGGILHPFTWTLGKTKKEPIVSVLFSWFLVQVSVFNTL